MPVPGLCDNSVGSPGRQALEAKLRHEAGLGVACRVQAVCLVVIEVHIAIEGALGIAPPEGMHHDQQPWCTAVDTLAGPAALPLLFFLSCRGTCTSGRRSCMAGFSSACVMKKWVTLWAAAIPQAAIPQAQYPKLQYPKLRYPKLRYPKLQYPKLQR